MLHSQPDYHFQIPPIKSLICDADVVVDNSLSQWQVVGDSVTYIQYRNHLWQWAPSREGSVKRFDCTETENLSHNARASHLHVLNETEIKITLQGQN